MAVVVDANTVVYPWTVTGLGSAHGSCIRLRRYLLVVFCNAAITPAAMLAPKRSANHACDAEVGLVKLPQSNQLIDDGLLFSDAAHLGHKAGVFDHAEDVEVCRESEKSGE